MIVYGDHAALADPHRMLASIRATSVAADGAAPGVARHDLLVAALIEAGELAQGLCDAAAQAAGHDHRSPVQSAAMNLVLALARRVAASWTAAFGGAPAAIRTELDELASLAPPDRIMVKQPEGFAHYALYPEAYAEAGRDLAPETCVIGLRSIGTSLVAMVAAGAGAVAPVTVRPVGHPFRRQIRLDPTFEAQLLGHLGPFAVVDEGPGLSGSSMNAVADRIEAGGVAPGRIVFLPGHGGDLGPQASPRHAARWREADRRVLSFDECVLPRLASAVEALAGPALAPLDDLSGGLWRRHRFDSEADWPPVHATQEKRKFLLRTASGPWLLKFVGLGHLGAAALGRARRLHEAGVGPEPLGVRLGFMVERWHPDAEPLRMGADRRQMLPALGRYLGLRGTLTTDRAGADLPHLAEMTRINIGEALGEDAARAWEHTHGDISGLQAPMPVETDNRLHAWEWLRCADGRILKTDGIDHHRAHDLIGCQDIAWDIAGAMVEFDLDAGETERLIAAVECGVGRGIDRALLRWFTPAYLAFQLGLWSMAAAQATTAERARIDPLLASYRSTLRTRLGLDGGPGP